MLDTWIVLLRDGTASKSGFCTADVFLLIVAKGSPLRERRRVGKKTGRGHKKGQKKGEKWRRKALLIANRTQAVVSLTVYDVYIYIYMHSAMWPVDSSSSSLFSPFLPLLPLF